MIILIIDIESCISDEEDNHTSTMFIDNKMKDYLVIGYHSRS